MPAGLSWPRYISFITAAGLAMLAGSQTVHQFYKPLDDLDQIVEQEFKRRKLQK